MSKRFGRNQRRALQQRIKEWMLSCQMQRSLTACIREERDLLSQPLKEVEHVLGPYFVGLAPKTVAHQFLHGAPQNFSIPIDSPARFAFPPSFEPISIEGRCERVLAWLLRCECFLDEVRGSVHVELSYEGTQSRTAYMVSESALATMDIDQLTRFIAPQLATALQQAVQSHGVQDKAKPFV